jgi:hypothetical protein
MDLDGAVDIPIRLERSSRRHASSLTDKFMMVKLQLIKMEDIVWRLAGGHHHQVWIGEHIGFSDHIGDPTNGVPKDIAASFSTRSRRLVARSLTSLRRR